LFSFGLRHHISLSSSTFNGIFSAPGHTALLGFVEILPNAVPVEDLDTKGGVEVVEGVFHQRHVEWDADLEQGYKRLQYDTGPWQTREG